MNIKIEELEGKLVATLEGELDTSVAHEVETALSPLFDSNGRDIIIDCAGLEYIASSGLRILLGILKSAKAAGSRVILRNVSDVIHEVFELTGFVKIFEFE